MKKLCVGAILLLLCIGAARATVSFVVDGTSGKGVAVQFEATFDIVGDTLTLVLINSSPVPSQNPDDTIGSFYFDIVDEYGNRPTLTLMSAIGDLYQGVITGTSGDPDNPTPDTLIQADADLMALGSQDSWVYKEMDETSNPWLGFGIGTVGNNGLGINNFPGLDGVESSIYTGDIEVKNLDKSLILVKDSATFTFSGLTGYSEADIADEYAFGLGTAPDSLLVPEPATLALLGLGGVLLRRKK